MAAREIKVRYIKCNDFRTVLSTGFLAAFGNNGLFNINFYVDRNVIPQSETATIDQDTNEVIGDVRMEKDGNVTREVQFGTLFDINTAKKLVKWLSNEIEESEKQHKS